MTTNNPGKKNEPVRRPRSERQDREHALYAYIMEHFPAYRAWEEAQTKYGLAIWDEAQRRFPQPGTRGMDAGRVRAEVDRKRAAYRKLQITQWFKAHPNPLTWEKRRELEAEFAKTYGAAQ
jgi:hypothetical protein